MVAACWRVALASLYFGSEEEDWGNLGLIVGALQSGFSFVETEHMPLFVDVSAAVMWIVGDAERAGEIVALVGSLAATALVMTLGARLFGPRAGLWAGVAYAIQPESALYAASPLREGPYAAFTLLGAWWTVSGAGWRAGIAFALAFFTRFDALFTWFPALLIGAFVPSAVAPACRRALVPAAGAVASWAALYAHIEGDWRFWRGVVARNTTDLRDYPLPERIHEGIDAVLAVGGGVVPAHVGHAVFGLMVVGLLGSWIRPGWDGGPVAARRWFALGTSGVFGFYLLTVAITAYDPGHNLYWKWLAPSLPWLLLAAAAGLTRVLAAAPTLETGSLGRVLTLALVASTVAQYLVETQRQLGRSRRWYGTQVHLVRWFDEHAPPEHAVVADLIPASWLARRPGGRTVISWSDDGLPHGDLPALGAFLQERGVRLVLWYREEWVGAAVAAPELAAGAVVVAGPVQLHPIAREDEYGFLAYEVSSTGADASLTPPAEAGSIALCGASPPLGRAARGCP